MIAYTDEARWSIRPVDSATIAAPVCSHDPPLSLAAAGINVAVQRRQLLFDFNESIHAAHGLAFATRSGALQAAVSTNFRNELLRPFIPHACGADFACDQSRAKRSADAGRTWQAVPVNASSNRSVSEFTNYAFELPDGEIMQLSGYPFPRSSVAAAAQQFEMLRSTDDARTQRATLASFASPAGMAVTSTSHSSIVQLADGSLRTNVYGTWANRDGYNAPARRSKTRVAYRSDDRGAS